MTDCPRFLSRRAKPIALLLSLAAIASACCAAEQVPIRFVDGLPVVQVGLGAVKVDFLLDTGGQIGVTVPAPLINGATDVKLLDAWQKTGDAAGHAFNVQKLTAASVRLGAVELGPVEGLVHYTWGLSLGDQAAPDVTKQGALGLGALSRQNVLLDMASGSMTLYPRGEHDRPQLDGWTRIPFEYDRRGVVVKFVLNGIDVSMALDTAATTSTIKRDAAIFAKMKSPCRGAADAPYCGLLNLPLTGSDGAHLGRQQIAVIRMGGIPFDGLLGIDFFRTRAVYLDFDADALYVQDASTQKMNRRSRKSVPDTALP